jgi:hypothetical protein
MGDDILTYTAYHILDIDAGGLAASDHSDLNIVLHSIQLTELKLLHHIHTMHTIIFSFIYINTFIHTRGLLALL